MQNAAVASSYGALGTKATAFTGALAAVAAALGQLRDDQEARNASRILVEGELDTLRAIVANAANGAGDITGMGFTPYTPPSQTRTVPAAPAVVIVRPEKVHGRASATVQETGTLRGNYVAEATSDPISPASAWTSLAGNGKQRRIVGPTGTKVWVRFAQVRYGLQSDWSTPVLVTLP